MGKEKNLLDSLPRVHRDLEHRHSTKTPESVKISQLFSKEYFDGPREYGYGGYHYDGRWLSVAQAICNEYSLKPGMKVLDIGCAKGFLVKDLMQVCPGLEVFGLDISEYALMNSELETVGRLHLGNARSLPFPNASFDLVLSINTLHNLEKNEVAKALREIQRVSKQFSYLVVDSYRSQREKDLFEKWVLTAKFHDFPRGWLDLFRESGYVGDYHWTIISEED